MKSWPRRIKNLLAVAFVAAFLIAGVQESRGAGTVTVTSPIHDNGDIYQVQLAWTADAAAATVPSTAFSFPAACWLYIGVTDPGATAPTDDYDITVSDTLGADVFGGTLVDRDTATSEQATPAIGSWYGPRLVSGALTFALANNSVNSAVGTLLLQCAR